MKMGTRKPQVLVQVQGKGKNLDRCNSLWSRRACLKAILSPRSNECESPRQFKEVSQEINEIPTRTLTRSHQLPRALKKPSKNLF